MRCLFILVLLLLSGSSPSWAQTAPSLLWQRKMGVRRTNQNFAGEQVQSLTHTRLHNRLVAVGSYQTNNDIDATLWLLNNRGDSLRTVTYPSPILGAVNGLQIDIVQEAPNGDFLMLGQNGYANGVPPNITGNSYPMLLRTDSLGNQRWLRRYNGPDFLQAFALQPLPDNGALLVVAVQHPLGSANFPVNVPTVIRVDSLGNVVWRRTYGRPYSSLRAITPLPDGSYALAGNYQTGPPQWDSGAWLLRLNLNGDTLRSRVIPNAVFNDVSPAPGGGLVLAGGDGNGVVLGLDSLDRVQWRGSVAPLAVPTGQMATCYLYLVRALATPGHVLTGGFRNNVRAPFTNWPLLGYLAEFATPLAPGAAPTTVWEQQYPTPLERARVALGPNREITAATEVTDGLIYDSNLLFTRLAPLPALYQVPYCQRPPAAYFAAAATAAAVQVLEASTPGPRYAQLVAWRWAWGDGSTGHGPAPGAHAYATPPPPGTPVTLTVTNNLGCTGTYTAYPFGAPTATQQQRALAARLAVFPNPAAGAVRVALGGLGPQGPAALALLDALGRVVLAASAPVAAGQLAAELDLHGVPPGLYLLRVTTREGTATRRLVRE